MQVASEELKSKFKGNFLGSFALWFFFFYTDFQKTKCMGVFLVCLCLYQLMIGLANFDLNSDFVSMIEIAQDIFILLTYVLFEITI